MRDTLIGTRIDRYEIREAVHKSDVIGIYKAYDTKLERFVLIKTILHSSDYSQEAIDFFLAESRTLAKLAHPNIAKVLDFGYEDGNLYLISEYIQGTLLSDMLNRPMPWQQAINILLPLTQALIYAHSRGIIHRDLKPDNVIINTDDQPILSDFSLMRIIEQEETRDMTGTNVGLGSPEYISPEQGKGLTVDFRSDIYSLGVIFFEMVTGKKLFYATSSMEIVIQHIMADPPRPRSIIPSLPRMVETLILNALSKDPEKRYQTMEEFSNAMKAVVDAANQEKNKTTSRPSRRMILSIAGASLFLLAIGFVFRNQLFPPVVAVTTSVTPQVETITPAPLGVTPEPATPTQDHADLTTPVAPDDDPFGIFELPEVPVLPGTKLPSSAQVLDASNVSGIRELARWESPDIRGLALLDDDRVILAATSAGLYLLDPENLSARKFFDTGGALVTFTVSDDEELVATANDQGEIVVWNLHNGSAVHRLQDERYTAKTIKSLDFSPDKTKLVFSDNQKNIHFWNLTRDQYFTFEKRLTSDANKVLFADGGDTVLSGGDNFQIAIWNANSGEFIEQHPAAQKINDMSLSSDGRYLVLALDEATLQIWDWFAKQPINEFKDQTLREPYTFITFLPNESTFLVGSSDGFIRKWNITGSAPLWEITSVSQDDHPQTVNAVRVVAVSKSGRDMVVSFEDGVVETWDLVGPRRLLTQSLGFSPITGMTISPDDQFVVWQGRDSFVELFSVDDDTKATRIAGTLPRGSPIAPNSKMISIVQRDNISLMKVYPLSAATTEEQALFTVFDVPAFVSVGYSPDSNLFTTYADGTFHYWSTSSGRELKASLPKRANLCFAIYRRDESFIVAASQNGVIYSNQNLGHFCQVPRNARTLSETIMPDGSIIALSLQNQLLEIWDVNRARPDPKITVKSPGDVWDVAISTDGKLLATASAGGAVDIYDLETMTWIKTLELKTGPVYQVLFSSDGRYLITGSADGTLRFFGLYP